MCLLQHMLRRKHFSAWLGQTGSIKLHGNSAGGYRFQGTPLQLSGFSFVLLGLRAETEPFYHIHMSYNII
ncbi:hypothetical protein D3C75_1324150 [compost metagenome]